MTQDFLKSVRKHVLKPVLIFKSLGLVSAEDVCPAMTVVTSTTDLIFNSSVWFFIIICTLVGILSTLVCCRRHYGQNFFKMLEKAPDIYISGTALRNARPGKRDECYHDK